jgi:hypothetical protein
MAHYVSRRHAGAGRRPVAFVRRWIPAFAGMTAASWNDVKQAGMTASRMAHYVSRRHAGAGPRPVVFVRRWIPAFAGMTAAGWNDGSRLE